MTPSRSTDISLSTPSILLWPENKHRVYKNESRLILAVRRIAWQQTNRIVSESRHMAGQLLRRGHTCQLRAPTLVRYRPLWLRTRVCRTAIALICLADKGASNWVECLARVAPSCGAIQSSTFNEQLAHLPLLHTLVWVLYVVEQLLNPSNKCTGQQMKYFGLRQYAVELFSETGQCFSILRLIYIWSELLIVYLIVIGNAYKYNLITWSDYESN